MGETNAWAAEVDWHTGRWRQRSPQPPPAPWQAPAPRGVLPKRRLNFIEAIDAGFRLLRFAPGPAIGAPLILFSLWTLLLTAIGTAVVLSALPFVQDVIADEEALTGLSLLTQLGSFVVGILSLGLVHFLAGLVAVAAERSFLGTRTRLSTAWAALAGRRWRLVAAASLITVLDLLLLGLAAAPAGLLALAGAPALSPIAAGLGLLVWVGVIVWVNLRLAFVGVAIGAEDLGLAASLRRSWRLTGQGFWRLLGQLGLGYFLSNQLVQIVISPFVLVLSTVVTVVVAAGDAPSHGLILLGIVTAGIVLALTVITSALLCGYFACLVSVCAFDVRMRQEGFDLDLIRRAEAR